MSATADDADGGEEARLVEACPNCDRAGAVSQRSPRSEGPETDDADYYCRRCHTSFDEPDVRPAQSEGSLNPGTYGRTLLDADPGEPLEAVCQRAVEAAREAEP